METKELINYEDKTTLDLLKNTVAQGTTNDEFNLFVNMCKATGLNPVKKEVWCIVTNPNSQYRKLQMMTGINGFYAIANSHPQYDGMKINYGPLIDVSLPPNKPGLKSIKVPEYVEVEVFRKDRRFPQVARAYWHEYAKDLVNDKTGYLGIWAKLSSVMLSKCAESMGLRKAFPQELNGFYTAEEMPVEFSNFNTVVASSQLEPTRQQTQVQAPESDDEIPEFGDYVYDIESFYENDERANAFEAYIEKLKASAVKFELNLELQTLKSDRELPKLKNYLRS